MAIAKLTLIGLEEYMQSRNMSLFSSWSPPANTIDKDEFISNLFLRAGELPVVIDDPFILQFYIGAWGTKVNPAISRMWNALTEEYNPIHNYDRTEEEAASGTKTADESRSETEASRRGRTNQDNSVDTSAVNTQGSTVNEQQNTAYDSGTYANVQKDTSTVGDTQSSTGTAQRTSSESENTTKTESGLTQAAETRADSRRLHAYGNIGVTTSAEMVEQEMALRRRYNIYDMLAEMFMTDFCVCVY